jgi:hypothetical protein
VSARGVEKASIYEGFERREIIMRVRARSVRAENLVDDRVKRVGRWITESWDGWEHRWK